MSADADWCRRTQLIVCGATLRQALSGDRKASRESKPIRSILLQLSALVPSSRFQTWALMMDYKQALFSPSCFWLWCLFIWATETKLGHRLCSVIGGSLGVHLEAGIEAKTTQNTAYWLTASGSCSASFLTKPSTTNPGLALPTVGGPFCTN